MEQCTHDWGFDGENSAGTEADFSCHLCGATKTVQNPPKEPTESIAGN